MKPLDTPHHPVLLKFVLEVLAPKSGESYFDGTAGFGGHAAAVGELVGPSGQLTLTDRDEYATAALAERFGKRAHIIRSDFLAAAKSLAAQNNQFDMVLLDLGVSSPQFDNPERGFSFRSDAPLDMRMDTGQELTAAEVLNTWPEAELEHLLREYGEEPKARAVARAIVAARPLRTTGDLARVARSRAVKPKDIDAATRTFQAIRIAVNAELQQLEEALPILSTLLSAYGRIGVISFHSLEDRIVKQFFDRESKDCICPPKQPVCTCGHVATLRKITKSPIVADANEIAFNPRARSAKLRAAEKK